jgi:hypothetical protein
MLKGAPELPPAVSAAGADVGAGVAAEAPVRVPQAPQNLAAGANSFPQVAQNDIINIQKKKK